MDSNPTNEPYTERPPQTECGGRSLVRPATLEPPEPRSANLPTMPGWA